MISSGCPAPMKPRAFCKYCPRAAMCFTENCWPWRQKRVGKRKVMCRATTPGAPYWVVAADPIIFRVPKHAIEMERFKKSRIFRYK